MKALVKAEAEPGLWLQDVPEPKIEADEVLIKVLRTGLCGTDLHIQSWDHWAQKNVPVPMVTGHEFCGEVVEVGVGVRDVAVGDVVSGEGHLVCGRCRNCRAGRRHLCIKTRGLGVHVPGAFAEYVALPASNAWVHRDQVDLDVAAIFDPFGNAVHTALSFPLVGEDVLITGAGPIGVMAAAVALARGRAQRGDHGPVGVPAGSGPQDRRHPRGERRRRDHRGGPARPRDAGRVRRRDGDVRAAGRAARHAREHDARREDRDARPARRTRSRSTGARWCSTC